MDYFFALNLQGDVVALLNSSGTVVAEYAYDPWGKVLSVTNSSGTAITSTSNIANRNPLRYRGYYYDNESGFYYLQSRYYDPEIKRFVNADDYASTGQGFLGYNMFAYCRNNPINLSDPNGEFAISASLLLLLALGIVVVGIGTFCILITPQYWQLSGIITDSLWSIGDQSAWVLSEKEEQEPSQKEGPSNSEQRSLPKEGPPNSDADLYTKDGTLKQKRHYGGDGSADYDVDFTHSDDGTHEFPHVHPWINGERENRGIPFDEYFSNRK